ncbi:MAG: NADH-quinone oxidoreductase subunit M [Rickettsiales bacterium]|nr:MAG: NADH-quinone oxidoreductase subunit M [Rickettsiales bacterium]
MLTSLLAVPLAGVIALVPITNTSPHSGSRMKRVALGVSLLNFIISMVLWGEFDSSTSEYQFTQEFLANQVTFCHLQIGIDGISLYFVLLTTFITPICILSNWDSIIHGLKYFLIAFLVLETLLIAVFVVLDILLFYIFFESVLIPLFLIVGIWGGSATRVRAAFLLFLYTLFGSLFMLLAFLVMYYNVGSTDFGVLALSEIHPDSQRLLWLAIFVSMAIKTPTWPFQIWLLRAHAEAPVAGSVILAAIVLKLATYGYMRILLQFFPDASDYFSPLVQTVAVITIIYASLATLRQTDFKAMIAYSSVAHMGVVLLGLSSNTIQGIEGAILLGIAHAFVSPALFILLGGVLYDRYHTRTIRYYRGMTAYMPLFSLFFFLFTIFNSAVPLSVNWAGEFLSLTGTFQQNALAAFLGSTGIVLSAGYSIWLYNRISFGSWSKYLSYTTDLTRREFMLLLTLLIPTVLFGIFPNVILDTLHVSVSTLLYSTNPLFITQYVN